MLIAGEEFLIAGNGACNGAWNLVSSNGEYEFSSEAFYINGTDKHKMLTHYLEYFVK
ncbi:MAG: hypothetical protein ACOYMA_21565 [Bacteroidia bacterium]